jgi:hypothetical protein
MKRSVIVKKVKYKSMKVKRNEMSVGKVIQSYTKSIKNKSKE